MKIQFDRLFQVEMLHTYYQSETSNDFSVEPISLCQSLLHNYRLLFKKTSKGFLVLYEYEDDDKGNPHPVKPIEKDLKFSFILTSKNPFLVNYSNLPLDSTSEQIYYLHNLNNNQKNNQLLLTSDVAREFLSTEDRINLRPQLFTYSVKSLKSTITIEVRDEFNKSLLTKTAAVNEGVAAFSVDLRAFNPGKFTLMIEGAQESVFYADSELIGKNTFAIIELYRNANVPTAYRFTDLNNDVIEKTYTVKIENRKTFWKYYIVLKYNPQILPGDLSITYPDPLVRFTQQPVEALSDGTSAVPFMSDTELALHHAPVKSIQLHRANANNTSVVLNDNLPNPSVATLKPDRTDTKIYSEIYFYV